MPKKILIVDDDPGIIRVLQTRLEANGYEVIAASDGKDGLEKATTLSPDLIILDVIMPEMDGLTLCGILKFDEQYASTPIIMLTIKGEEIDREVGRKVKADAYLTKPFRSEDLLEKIKELIGEE